MRAMTTTTAVLPGATRVPTTPRSALPAPRRASGWDRLFARRRKASLFHRCLAVHMATAGTLSALR